MLATPHAVTGAAIAILFPNPVVFVPVAVVAHFALDVIPHWQEVIGGNYKPNKVTLFRLPADIILAFVLIWFIASRHPLISNLIWLSALISNLPDLDVVATNIFPRLLNSSTSLFKKYYDWHCNIQKETKSFGGVLTQVATIGLGLLIAM